MTLAGWTRHQACKRRRSDVLHAANLAIERHKARYHRGPVGAPVAQWLAYIEWLNERKEVLGALLDNELRRIIHEQRRNQNERKRDKSGGGPVRGT